MAFKDASPRLGDNHTTTATTDAQQRRGDSPILVTQPPNGANPHVKRPRNGNSKKRKTFIKKFLLTFGNDKGFERLKKATENFFDFVSIVVTRVVGVIALIASVIYWLW